MKRSWWFAVVGLVAAVALGLAAIQWLGPRWEGAVASQGASRAMDSPGNAPGGPRASRGDDRRLALVIGNGGYHNAPLRNPTHDAQDLAAKLERLDFEVTRLLDADQRAMEEAIRGFTRALARGGVGLFYYAGHGLEVGGENYLIPIGAQIERESDVRYEAVAAGRVLDGMREAGNGLNLVVLDACRNNPYGRGFRSASRGLARMSPASGALILYATEPGQVAADGDGRNGVFTRELLAALDEPGISLFELAQRTAARVHRETGGKQTPWQEGMVLGQFYLRPPAPGPVVAPPPPLRGYLQVSVNTEARVTVAGRTVGTARPGKPLNLSQGLPVGEVEVAVSADGYADQSRRVAIAPNAWAQVHFELAAEPPPRAPYEPELVAIPGGCFQMGSPTSEAERDADERRHRVCVDAFKIGKYEVTQAQWKTMMGSNPSRFSGCDDCPVENVSWNDVNAYIGKLNARTGKGYRLPSEAEWEYAARAGTTTPFWSGACIDTDQANYNGDYDYNGCGAKTGVYRGKTLPVGSLQANAWGLHDVAGNVWEWTCSAYVGAEQRCASKNHAGWVALRGGSWGDSPRRVRSAYRITWSPDYWDDLLGFRLAQD